MRSPKPEIRPRAVLGRASRAPSCPAGPPRHAATGPIGAAAESWSLPGYVVEELLGSGSSGDVWRARVRTNRQRVALKRVWVRDADHRRRALREAEMLARLDHPHVIRLRESVARRMSVVLVLDLAEHGSLADVLARRSRLSVPEVTGALAPIASALAHAHQQGIVHGDVTPANILFAGESIPLLADLGVARIVGEAEPVRTTAGYLDPAVACGALPVPTSDVFMLAATAVHALTGRALWNTVSFAAALAEARAYTGDDLGSRLAEVPAVVRGLLAAGLSADPYQRPSAAAFAQELALLGPPAVLDLRAGRRREAPSAIGVGHRPRHAAPAAEERRIPARTRARPQFDRPGLAADPLNPALEPFTRGVRIPAASLPPRRLRRLRTAVPLDLPARLAMAACAAVVLAGGGWAYGAYAQRAAPSPAGAGGRIPAAAVPKTASAASTASTGATNTTTATGAPLSDAQAASVLNELDTLRGRAFASNDTALLNQVYGSTALRDQDAALIARLVPAGCGLLGVRTQYSDVRTVATGASRFTVTASATLDPTTLVCAEQVRSTGAASAAIQLQTVLVRQSGTDDYRIVSQVHL